MISVALNLSFDWGFIDKALIDPTGLIRLVGWSNRATWKIPLPAATLNNIPLRYLKAYRYSRPDVIPGGDQLVQQSGLIFEFLLSAVPDGQPYPISALAVNGRETAVQGMITYHAPHYASLLDTTRVQGRNDIYGFGPPNATCNPEFTALLTGIKGKVLDFGCGVGHLVAALRDRDIDAYGIEIDREPIREGLAAKIKPYVTLYNGNLPSPFATGSFDTVISTEVLEHIPDPRTAVAEMARLSKKSLVLTVPDLAAIPMGSPYGLVPWHLLESTHINFFTQNSLGSLLSPFFSRIEFGRMTASRINETPYFVSLIAVCTK